MNLCTASYRIPKLWCTIFFGFISAPKLKKYTLIKYLKNIWALWAARTPIKVTVQAKKNLYYSFDSEENVHTYVITKNKMGWRSWTSFHLLQRKRVIPRKRKKGVRVNELNGRTVQRTQLILTSIETEFCALQNYRQFFFELNFSFLIINFFLKNSFLLKKLKIQTA